MNDTPDIPNPEDLEPEDFYTGSIDDERYRNQDLIPEHPFENAEEKEFRRTGQRPIPAFRCWYVRPDGTRCKNYGIRGTGLNGTKAVCRFHGGSLPAVKKHAQSMVDASRMILQENLEPAVLEVVKILTADSSGALVKLKAAEFIADRAGLTKGPAELEITVNQIDAAAIIREKMKAIEDNRNKSRQRAEEIVDEPELVDEGEINLSTDIPLSEEEDD